MAPTQAGTLVLAAGIDGQDNLAGWWEAIIVRIDDNEFLVRWRDESIDAGLSLPSISQLLGHTKVQTRARYAHLSLDPLRRVTCFRRNNSRQNYALAPDLARILDNVGKFVDAHRVTMFR